MFCRLWSEEEFKDLTISTSSPTNSHPVTPRTPSPFTSEGTSFPPFHPAVYTQPMISDDPVLFQSHFIRLKVSNRKGQARYRCVTCSHEFECTGKLRLVQHILGRSYTGSQSRNVKYCPNPHLPLKNALLLKHGQNKIGPNTPVSSSPKATVPQNFPVIKEERKTTLPKVPSKDSFSSYVSSVDEEGSTSHEDFDGLFEFLLSVGATEENFISEERSIANIEQFPPAKRVKNNDDFVNFTETKRMQANKCLGQFFRAYNIPLNATKDALFLEFLNAIQYVGPMYRPALNHLSDLSEGMKVETGNVLSSGDRENQSYPAI